MFVEDERGLEREADGEGFAKRTKGCSPGDGFVHRQDFRLLSRLLGC